MKADPSAQHGWLKKLSGEWTYEASCPQGPGKEPMIMRGRESVRMLGELWSLGTMHGETPDGGAMEALLTIGYDPARGKFVGSWVGSPMTQLFVYEGELDAAQRVLTLSTTGPSFTDPAKRANYHDIIELVDENTKIFRSELQTDDGSWQEFMRSTHRRA